MKLLFNYIGKYKKYVYLTLIFIVFESFTDISIPYLTGKILDQSIINNYNFSYFVKMSIIMIFVVIFSLISGILAGCFSAVAGTGLATNLKREIFNKVQNFSFSNIEYFSTSSLLVRDTIDIRNIKRLFALLIRGSVRSVIIFTGSIIMAIFTSKKLSFILMINIPILSILIYSIFIFNFDKYKKLLNLQDKFNSNIQENLISIREIKSFVKENYEKTKFNKLSEYLKNVTISVEKIDILIFPIIQLIIFLSTIFILYIGGNEIIKNNMKIGDLNSFFTYCMETIHSLMMISRIFYTINLSKASKNRIMEILNTKSKIKDSNTDSVFKDGSFEFKNVSFSYYDNLKNLVLKNINLKVNNGEFIGIIGSAGSGKSTLIQLLLRLYDITSGELIIGKNNIKNYTLKTLRENISIVLQKNILFSGTIKENLLWSGKNASDKEIKDICKIVQADSFIKTFENGYDTYIEQNGKNVSGGQKQRLCIARSLLKKPKILILDDSTSALDMITEKKLITALKNNFIDVTKIIISQKISSIIEADKIIIINDGKIDEIGNHNTLLKNNKIYQELYFSQRE